MRTRDVCRCHVECAVIRFFCTNNSTHIMNNNLSALQMKPNQPLRRPATGPLLMTQNNQILGINDDGASQERSLMSGSLDVGRNLNELKTTVENSSSFSPMSSSSVIVRLCNYCSKRGNLKCTCCKKTCYCSAACQTEDWKAHRHTCKPCSPEDKSNKLQESTTISCSNVSEQKPKRIFLGDLQKHNISKGDTVAGFVVELENPGRFFIQIQMEQNTENLRNISMELEKCYSHINMEDYKPEVGEICAVKFSLDQKWYRGEVASVNVDRHTAQICYIDYGNEEVVSFNLLHPLAENISPAPPCALQCSVAGVRSVTSSWTGECCIAVRQLVARKILTFTVLDFINDAKVLAVDMPLFSLGKNLSTFLIDQGYAEVAPDLPPTKPDINSLMNASFENFKCVSGGKNENNESQSPESLSQGVGDIFKAIVVLLESPSKIICQKLENASVIQQLQNDLMEHCTKTPASENYRPAPGTICCACFSDDNHWYRAKVLAYSSKTQVCVGYIDFGNSEEVHLSHLRPISENLLSLATQAFPCALAGIKPTTDDWSEEVITMLNKLICNRFIQVEILGARAGLALVAMVDESSDPQTNVADVLVASGYAAAGELEIEKEESPKAWDVKSVNELDWSYAELPTNGQKVVLVVSVLENPSKFYCYNYNKKDFQTLAKLSLDLAKHFETERVPFTPVAGEPCCALYNDGSWYRAIVQSVENDGKVQVFFADFGGSCEIQQADLRAIDSVHLKFPFQVIRCCLAGVEPLGEKWSEDAICRFRSLCIEVQLMGRVLSVTERGYEVELESNNQNLATVLISENLAKPSGQDCAPTTPPTEFTKPIQPSPAVSPDPANSASLTEQPDSCNGPNSGSSQANMSPSFSLNWKTTALPCNETFQPEVAAVSSPSLFYVMNLRKEDTTSLQMVMKEVASYCDRQTVPNKSIPLPGAACCAQFTGDKKWYRAVVLETTSTHASVIYVDFGNVEKVPLSSLLPIPKELLQHPFQIARCALAGKEHFPSVWPPAILELFSIQLKGKLLASVQDFDGTFNLLNVTQHLGEEGCNISSVIIEALQQDPNESIVGLTPLDTLAQEEMRGGEDAAQGQSADTEKPQSESPDTGLNSCCCYAGVVQKVTKIEELVLLIVQQLGAAQK